MRFKSILGLCVFSILMVACHSVKQVSVKKNIPSITEGRLLKNIDIHELEYATLFAKRLDISFKNGKNNNNFKASLKIKRDTFIQATVTAPLGIEVARILLTTDSIKFVDTYHKKFFVADYDDLYDKFDFRVDFDYVQKVLTNTFITFEEKTNLVREKKYKLERTDVGYELSTIEEKALTRKIKKFYKKRRKNKDFILILQKILVDPDFFRPIRISVEDLDEDISVSVDYEAFKDFSGKFFPEKMIFSLQAENNTTTLELKFLKVDFDIPVEANLKISPKYKRIE